VHCSRDTRAPASMQRRSQSAARPGAVHPQGFSLGQAAGRARAGSATSVAAHQLREARVHEHAAAAAVRGREYGAKTYSFLRGVVGSVAGQVETLARDNGIKVDLGARHQGRPAPPRGCLVGRGPDGLPVRKATACTVSGARARLRCALLAGSQCKDAGRRGGVLPGWQF